jgi:Icc-related predicted phosphoesterase
MAITKAFFVSDLHGRKTRYDKLFEAIEFESPELVLIGGDVLPSGISILTDENINGDFLDDFLANKFELLKDKMKDKFPLVLMIAGNDDPKSYKNKFFEFEERGYWKYLNEKVVKFEEYFIAGYAYVPPTPFLLKDWEKYDVSRFVDVGCVSPEEGFRSVKKEGNVIRHETISEDLEKYFKNMDFEKSVFLFHSPPYKTNLDRINTTGKLIDYVQPDEHVGSIAIQRFIESKQPLLTLHGHIHESASITDNWKDTIGRTVCVNGSTEKNKLALVKFSIEGETVVVERELL